MIGIQQNDGDQLRDLEDVEFIDISASGATSMTSGKPNLVEAHFYRRQHSILGSIISDTDQQLLTVRSTGGDQLPSSDARHLAPIESNGESQPVLTARQITVQDELSLEYGKDQRKSTRGVRPEVKEQVLEVERYPLVAQAQDSRSSNTRGNQVPKSIDVHQIDDFSSRGGFGNSAIEKSALSNKAKSESSDSSQTVCKMCQRNFKDMDPKYCKIHQQMCNQIIESGFNQNELRNILKTYKAPSEKSSKYSALSNSNRQIIEYLWSMLHTQHFVVKMTMKLILCWICFWTWVITHCLKILGLISNPETKAEISQDQETNSEIPGGLAQILTELRRTDRPPLLLSTISDSGQSTPLAVESNDSRSLDVAESPQIYKMLNLENEESEVHEQQDQVLTKSSPQPDGQMNPDPKNRSVQTHALMKPKFTGATMSPVAEEERENSTRTSLTTINSPENQIESNTRTERLRSPTRRRRLIEAPSKEPLLLQEEAPSNINQGKKGTAPVEAVSILEMEAEGGEQETSKSRSKTFSKQKRESGKTQKRASQSQNSKQKTQVSAKNNSIWNSVQKSSPQEQKRFIKGQKGGNSQE